VGFEPTVTLPPQWFSRAFVVWCPTRLLPGLSACRSSMSSKIIPHISRDESDGRRQRDALVLAAIFRPVCGNPAAPCPVPGPSPNPIAAEPDGRRVLSRGGAADHAVTPQAPLTGSGCREYSYGGFGGGDPHFHPHTAFRKPDLRSWLSYHACSGHASIRCHAGLIHRQPVHEQFL
jgi:hypothetical protein